MDTLDTSAGAFAEAERYDQMATDLKTLIGDPALAHAIRERNWWLNYAAELEAKEAASVG